MFSSADSRQCFKDPDRPESRILFQNRFAVTVLPARPIIGTKRKTAVIIGAGPAGLTAAFELLQKSDILPLVYEQSGEIGGLSRTIHHQGNRIDIGGHRFFSKSERIIDWWLNFLPLQGKPAADDLLLNRSLPFSNKPDAPDPEESDRVMLVRKRYSRILFMKQFFDYPLSPGLKTMARLGISQTAKIVSSYMKIRLSPQRPIVTLEDLFIHRFGEELYKIFFRDYSEKIWGVPCRDIHADWGVQRIKTLSVAKTVMHAFRRHILADYSVSQKYSETSLIEQFLYPKFGPGHMWETVADEIHRHTQIHLHHRVTGLIIKKKRITAVTVQNVRTGRFLNVPCEYVFSTMPVPDLISAIRTGIPEDIRRIASGLRFRDFIIVGILLSRLKKGNDSQIPTINHLLPDQWIYIQEKAVKVGRLQIFNNWSPYLLKDTNKVWIGAEYFCNKNDSLWSRTDRALSRFAVSELSETGLVNAGDVLDTVVIRVPKTYPAYLGTYDAFFKVRQFTDEIANLFLIGRNGMHRYNNQDHSMMTAMAAVAALLSGSGSKENIWAVNTEEEYHENK